MFSTTASFCSSLNTSLAAARSLRSFRASIEQRIDLGSVDALGRRQVLLAFDEHVHFADCDDLRDLAFFQRKGGRFQLGIAHVAADRLDQPIGAGAVGVLGILFGQRAEFLGLGHGLGMNLAGLFGVFDRDQPHFDRRAKLAFIGLVQFLAG